MFIFKTTSKSHFHNNVKSLECINIPINKNR
ncbi:TPA: hypothetical protein PPX50_001992 [Staphylococcus aureus]|nr:hypothetical protein [Staphylococcus aureus]HDJ2543122.1 hypothetical protein [Staphylococcus aureus]HDY6597011.1 hypothetical protein [Staphylococcus aureus]